jgi:hypothetical protein
VTPLQKIAMGLLLVLLDVPFVGYDAVPDLAGWILVVLGLIGLRPRLANTYTLLWLAAIAAVVSGALFLPEVNQQLPESTEWLLSLPQLAFSVLLCTAVAGLRTGGPPPAYGFSAGSSWCSRCCRSRCTAVT